MINLECGKCQINTTSDKVSIYGDYPTYPHGPFTWLCSDPACNVLNVLPKPKSMPFDFIEKYLEYNSGNECPRNYHIWSALVILAATVHKRVWVHQGYFTTYPNLYVGLIGDMGSRKSTGKDIAYSLFLDTFPDYPILCSVQSREDIIKFMNTDACQYSFKVNESSPIIEVRPIAGFINELKNFLSVDPGKMIEFLTDIYSSLHFKSGTIKRGLEDIKNPCVNLLVCETPDWIIEKLKAGLISGGWGRRIVYVYETSRAEPIAFPQRPANHYELWQQFKAHLIRVSQVAGEFGWDDDARVFYKDWYDMTRRIVHEDKMMAGYYESKSDQLLKVAMGLAVSHEELRLMITKNNLIRAVAMLDVLEENMPKLSVAAGRNELAVPIQRALEAIEKSVYSGKPGWIPEKAFKKLISKDLTPMEMIQVLRLLQETDDIFIKSVDFITSEGKVSRLMVMNKVRHDEMFPKIKK